MDEYHVQLLFLLAWLHCRLFVEVDELENLLSGQGLVNARNELQSIIKDMQLEFTSRIEFEEFQTIMHRLS